MQATIRISLQWLPFLTLPLFVFYTTEDNDDRSSSRKQLKVDPKMNNNVVICVYLYDKQALNRIANRDKTINLHGCANYTYLVHVNTPV